MYIEFHRSNGKRRELLVENVWSLSSDALKELCALVWPPTPIPWEEYDRKIQEWYQRVTANA